MLIASRPPLTAAYLIRLLQNRIRQRLDLQRTPLAEHHVKSSSQELCGYLLLFAVVLLLGRRRGAILNEGQRIIYGRLELLLVLCGHLAEALQRIPQTIAVGLESIPSLNALPSLGILRRVLLGLAKKEPSARAIGSPFIPGPVPVAHLLHHALDFVVTEASFLGRDRNLLRLLRAFVDGADLLSAQREPLAPSPRLDDLLCRPYLEDTVCVDVEADFDLWLSARHRGNARQLEFSEKTIVSRHRSLSFEDLHRVKGLSCPILQRWRRPRKKPIPSRDTPPFGRRLKSGERTWMRTPGWLSAYVLKTCFLLTCAGGRGVSLSGDRSLRSAGAWGNLPESSCPFQRVWSSHLQRFRYPRTETPRPGAEDPGEERERAPSVA
eukprot:scaffold685_cov281-Pinguiococcus_pyrenoidosus.AAC.15